MIALSGAEPGARPTADEPEVVRPRAQVHPDGMIPSELRAEVVRLRAIESVAREVATYHVLGYGHIDEDVPWDANHMLHLLDKLAATLNE